MIRIPGIGVIEDNDPRAVAYKTEQEALRESSKTYKEKRLEEYGTVQEQLEYIVENGIDAFIQRQNAIKEKYPKE